MNQPAAATPSVRFGFFLSQANRTWQEMLDDFTLAEELGFDHAWLVDHLLDRDVIPALRGALVSP